MNTAEEYPNQRYGWIKENDGSWSLYAPDGTKVIGTTGNTVQVPTPVGTTDAVTKAYADAGGGGGGSTPFAGARVTLATDPIPDFDGSGPVPFNFLDWDSDGYWDQDLFKFVIPEGKAGLYSVTGLIYVDYDPSINRVIWFIEGNDPDAGLGGGFDFIGVNFNNSTFMTTIACDIYGHEGDHIYIDGGAVGVPTFGLDSASYCSLVYRGAPTLLF